MVVKRLLDYLELKEKTTQKQFELLNQRQHYIDCAWLLWYEVAYFDVMKHLQVQMELQSDPFMLADGVGCLIWIYGGITALPQNLYDTFEARAKNVLNAYGKQFGAVCKVRVARDAIAVKWVNVKVKSGSAASTP